MRIQIKKLSPDAILPTYAYEGAAGCDLYSNEDVVLAAGGHRAKVGTGIAVAIPEGHGGFVQPRSGLATRHGVSIVNTPGLVDSQYRGEVCVIMINTDPREPFAISKGDKIAQLVIQKVESAEFELVEELDETTRGEGGFGSSGHR